MTRDEDEQSRVFYQLCSMIINILGSNPFPIPIPTLVGTTFASSSSSAPRPSPAAFASLFLGISVALMLFGSAIFVIGFILMPWVIALVLLFYVAALASNLYDLVRAVLCPSTNDVAGWKLS